MQISRNTTGMPAGLATWTDQQARIHCVAVIKGTFAVGTRGAVALADEQVPLVAADEPSGEPGASATKYECDFAPEKPRAEVLVRGDAHAPGGRMVEQLMVSVQFGAKTKQLRVSGTRYWDAGVSGLRASRPRPFAVLPLTFEHAFGGTDHSAADPKHHSSSLENPVGKGFRANPDQRKALGTPLPEIEIPEDPLQTLLGRPRPAGLGVIGRGWRPRVLHAGAYDQRWLDDQFPFLPENFSTRYFQAAPEDQHLTHPLNAGFAFAATNLTEDGSFSFALPELTVPVRFRFDDRAADLVARADTLLVEPGERRFMLTWRALVPVGRKLSSLREVMIGTPPAVVPGPRMRNGKPHFRSLAELAHWRRDGGDPEQGNG